MATPAAIHGDPAAPILLALIVLTLAALVGGELMRLLRQPAVLGELLMGMLAGNLAYVLGSPGMTVLREGENLRRIADLALSTNVSLSQAALKVLPEGEHAQRIAHILSGAKGLEFIAVYSFVDILSRIAILILLFLVGLETNIIEMKRVGRTAMAVAVVGVLAPLALGLVTMKLLQPDSAWARDLFVGGILTATSVGITARVLRDLKQDVREEARVILGAAVLDDVLSLVVLAVVTGLAVTGTIDAASVTWTTGKATLFLGSALVAGVWLAPRIARGLAGVGIHRVKVLSGCVFAFFLAWLANQASLAPIVGAFAAGLMLSDFFGKETEEQPLRTLLAPFESLVVPLFFVWIGIQVKLETLGTREVLLAGLTLTTVAVVGKVLSGMACPKRMNRLAVGIGMIPRGEVGLIFAGIGKATGVIDDGLFSAMVLLVMVTTILAPPGLRWTLLSKSG